ncbi:1837_t:CDS:1, partial [Racocetra fulgida]
ALDAYSRAIRLNPYISEVWYDLGTLYESCNNQINDALDAYQRAAELDPSNPHIKQRLQMLRNQQAGGQTSAPIPQDVNPQAYQSPNGPPNMLGGNTPTFAQPTPGPPGPPGMPGYNRPVDNRPSHTTGPLLSSIPNHGEGSHRDLPPPMNRRSPGPTTTYTPPPHLMRDRPLTPPNQQHTLNPLISPNEQRSLTPHQSQPQQPPPLRHNSDKRASSPSPQLPQIQMPDDRHPRHSPSQLPEPYPPLRPNYPPSPRIITSEHGSSQISGYPHHDITHHLPVDRRESDIYDKVVKPDERSSNGVSSYHPSESLAPKHDSLPPINYHDNRDNLDPPIKRSDEPSLRPPDTRTPHRPPHSIEHSENRIQDDVPIDEKPPFTY